MDSGDFLARVMRRPLMCVCKWCILIRLIKNTFKDRAPFSKIKNIDWTLASEQPVKCSGQFTGWITARECPGPPLSRTWAYRSHLSGAGPTSPKSLRAFRNECSRIHDAVFDSFFWISVLSKILINILICHRFFLFFDRQFCAKWLFLSQL